MCLVCRCILKEVCQFNGACPRRGGATRAAASGRLRADRPGAFPDQYLKQCDNFIIQFISININDFVTIRQNSLRPVTIRYESLHFVMTRYISLHFVTIRYITTRYDSLRFVTSRNVTNFDEL